MDKENRHLTFLLIVLEFLLILTNSCEEEKPASLPELFTTNLAKITSTSVTSGGNITSDGGAVILARGICWATSFNPTLLDNITIDGAGAGSFVSSITGLTGGTNYYIRAYATNSVGTAYGNEFFLTTPVTDIDGNIYNTVKIGNQVWMTANLKTTRYNDSTEIPNVNDNVVWSILSAPAYCWYNNDDETYKSNYGALYNWYAVNTGKLCPLSWHVPSENEWMTLTNYFGGESVASGKLKEAGTAHWRSPNTGASNEFGFTALPGGYRTGLSSGSFRAIGYYGWWWASTESDLIGARARQMGFDVSEIAKGKGIKKNGYSVRCVKD